MSGRYFQDFSRIQKIIYPDKGELVIIKTEILLFLIILLSLFCTSSAVGGYTTPLERYAGTWSNVDQRTRGIVKLQVQVESGKVFVHAWGKCHPVNCDWGRVQAIPFAPNVSIKPEYQTERIIAIFETDLSLRYVILSLKPGASVSSDSLEVEMFVNFRRDDNRSHYYKLYKFKRQVDEDCVSFNPSALQVKFVNGRWKIVERSIWHFDFGSNKGEAYRALQIIQHYSMNKVCYVGRPQPSFVYLLSGNSAPSGNIQGEDCVEFNPSALEVKFINNRWKIVEGSHWLFDFGSEKEVAQRALNIIKTYGFRYSCFVGRPDPSFTYLKK